MSQAGELGIGISDFVSVGNKADVSGNDLLQYWADDPHTDVILMYLESFGNPRKFARLARRIAPHQADRRGEERPFRGRAAGRRRRTPPRSPTPDVAVDALFRQAGVIRVDTLDELLGDRDAARAPTGSGRAGGSRSSATPAVPGSSRPTRARARGSKCPS